MADPTNPNPALVTATPGSPEQRIADAIASRQMILAIKLLRQHTGMGLAESKRAIERGTWRELLH